MHKARSQLQSTMVAGVGYVVGVLGFLQHRLDGRKKDTGATAVEYGLLVGLIAIVIIVGVSALGGRLQRIFAQLAVSIGGG
jgi:pilus assembly protein Flp/PilA